MFCVVIDMAAKLGYKDVIDISPTAIAIEVCLLLLSLLDLLHLCLAHSITVAECNDARLQALIQIEHFLTK